MIRLISPEDGAVLSEKTTLQKEFLEHSEEYSMPDFAWRHRFGVGSEDMSVPNPFVFLWEGGSEDDEFVLSEADSGKVIFRQHGGSTGEVYNLLLNTAYRWQVGDSECRTFTTDDHPPRWIFLDGTFNVRDIGGWKTTDGRTIKQGLFYRGCEMDRALFITDKGIRTAREDLGIRTDLDLRGEMIGVTTQSPLGPDVRYEVFCALAYGECIDLPNGIAAAGQVFRVLADPDAYPVFLHCMAGADRTGTFAYLLLTLLGVSQDDVATDYEQTTLSNHESRSRHTPFYRSTILDLDKHGSNPVERVENYLTKCCGITEEEIARIRALFLEE
jgi:hypothetical protein